MFLESFPEDDFRFAIGVHICSVESGDACVIAGIVEDRIVMISNDKTHAYFICSNPSLSPTTQAPHSLFPYDIHPVKQTKSGFEISNFLAYLHT
jgi:hypothetical protein